MTPEREAEIRAQHARDGGRMSLSKTNTHRDRGALLAEIDRLRGLIDAAGAVISEIGCDCTCHGPDDGDGEHDDDCDGPCSVCRIADALQPQYRRGVR